MRARLIKLTAAAAVVVVILVTSASSASAATGSLTVTTLGRSGAKVATTVNIVNLTTLNEYSVASGKAIALPTGSYVALVDIWNPADGTDTVGASRVSVAAGTKSITIDARNGKSFSVRLDTNPGTDYVQVDDTAVCVSSDGTGSLGFTGGFNFAGKMFVIPNPSTALHFGYMSSWVNSAQTDAYVVSGTTQGLPGALGAVYKRSSLATWNATVRKGPAATSSVDLAIQPTGPDFCRHAFFRELNGGNQAPFTATAHVSAGPWELRSDGSDEFWYRDRTLTAGSTYGQTFYSAPWGPAGQGPYVQSGQVWFSGISLFKDPSAFGSECCAAATATLSFGSKVLSTQHFTEYGGGPDTFHAKISSKGWYTLNVSTTRSYPNTTYPADMLSKSNTVNFRFWGNPTTVGILPVYLTRFVPSALDLNNRAPAGRQTKVTLVPDRETNDPTNQPLRSVPITKIQAWWSNDDGATWHSAPVTKSGSTWSTVIPDPASGYVSLRATITNNSGVATTTITRAFGIG